MAMGSRGTMGSLQSREALVAEQRLGPWVPGKPKHITTSPLQLVKRTKFHVTTPSAQSVNGK